MTRSPGAHDYWDDEWKRPSHEVGYWTSPEPLVREVVQARARCRPSAGRALDVGCGLGRHRTTLEGSGFSVVSADLSLASLSAGRDEATDLRVVQCPFDALPLATGAFDYTLAWNVIYHGDTISLRRAARELCRVTAPGGTIQLTLLSTTHPGCGRGREVAERTYVDPDAGDDKIHPHCYVSVDEVSELFETAALVVCDLLRPETAGPLGHHIHVVAETNL